MPDVRGEIMGWLLRHLVSLEVAYTVKHEKKPPEAARTYLTGFLLWEVQSGDEGVAIWVTAGHWMRWIDQELLAKPESYSKIAFRFLDMLHGVGVSNLPIPFDYVAQQHKAWLVHTDENGTELGQDIGVIFLRPHYSRAMAANKILPVGEANWKDVPESFDKYYMLGLPAEGVRPFAPGTLVATPSLIELTRLAAKPACFAEQTDPMFYGVVDPTSPVRNIEGMSGGPIIGLNGEDEGNADYWVIAVQSSWFPLSRIVCASPLNASRDILRQAMKVIFPTVDGAIEAAMSPAIDTAPVQA